jgi:hypothetical protein
MKRFHKKITNLPSSFQVNWTSSCCVQTGDNQRMLHSCSSMKPASCRWTCKARKMLRARLTSPMPEVVGCFDPPGYATLSFSPPHYGHWCSTYLCSVTQGDNGARARRLSYCWTRRRSPFPFCPASSAVTWPRGRSIGGSSLLRQRAVAREWEDRAGGDHSVARHVMWLMES